MATDTRESGLETHGAGTRSDAPLGRVARANAELAAELYVGDGTVKTHVWSVLMKLGLGTGAQAVVYAYESGLVQPGV